MAGAAAGPLSGWTVVAFVALFHGSLARLVLQRDDLADPAAGEVLV